MTTVGAGLVSSINRPTGALSYMKIQHSSAGVPGGDPELRQRIQMVLLRESGMQAMGVSLSTVNRAHMAYDHGGLKALKSKPSGGRKRETSGGRKRENMMLIEEKALLARFTHPFSQPRGPCSTAGA
jgi:hypothetical protein